MAKTNIILLFKSVFISYVALISLLCTSKSNPLTQQTSTNTTTTTTTGFSIDIFHRDSPQSPYYDPSLSPAQKAVNAVRRSVDRWLARHAEADIFRYDGDYFMKYAIGTPAVSYIAVLDTGSEFLWLQCYPCGNCEKHPIPFYNPKDSSTHNDISCASDEECTSLTIHSFCSQKLSRCLFKVEFANKTTCSGPLAEDTIFLSTDQIKKFTFGCAYKNNLRILGYESSVVGLGRGPISLVRQLRDLAGGKFSYCMVSRYEIRKTSSKLNFGDKAVVTGNGAVHIPLEPTDSATPYYFVTLSGLTVGERTFKPWVVRAGNMIVDSGTAVTRFPEMFYKKLNYFVWKEMRRFDTIRDPGKLLDLCFNTKSDVGTPTVTLHFGDLDLILDMENIFIRTGKNALCLAALPGDEIRPGLLGYYAQANYLVGYDTVNEKISFKRADCTKL